MLVTNREVNIELIKRLTKHSYNSSNYNPEKGQFPDYPLGSYIPFSNPIIIKLIKKSSAIKNIPYILLVPIMLLMQKES